jgi:GNAT superfamily N-acetyltransferase
MPKNKEINIDALLDEQLGPADNARPNINRASFMNPDQQAEIITLAESRNLPTDTVENNLPEIKRRERTDLIDTTGYPKLSKYLTDDRNSRVSIDDIDNLKGIEGAVRDSEIGFFSNIGRGALSRVNTLTGNLIEFTGTIGKNFEDYLDSKGVPNPGIIIGDDGVSWSWDIPSDSPNLLQGIGKAISEGDGFGYQPSFTWERFKGDMNPKTLAGYIVEQGVQSLPDMLAAVYTLPAYVSSRTEEIAEERAKNDERKDVTSLDLVTSLVPAVAVSLIERVAGKVVLGKGGVTDLKTALKATGGAAAVEAGTEFIQEGIEYLGETVGTKKDLSLTEMADRQLAGLVAGGGMGGIIRGTTATVEALASRAQRNVETALMSAGEQNTIDTIAAFAQSSLTRGRKEDRFRMFLKGLDTDKQVLISSDPLIEVVNSGVELPPYITNQITGLGTDVAIDMEQFAADIAPNEDLMSTLRPHMKMSDETLTPAQIEKDEDLTIKSLLERAEKNQELKTESETIYEEVKDQIVATGRQSEATARYSAAIIPAYVTVKAEQTGKSPKEIYEMMGLSIVGPAAEQVGGDVLEQQERDQAISKGLDMSTDARISRAKDMGFDTDKVMYHGSETALDIKEFDLTRFGENYGTQGQPAIYTINLKEDAESFTGTGGDVIPLYLDKNNYEIIDGDQHLKEVYDSFESYQDQPFNDWVDSLSSDEVFEVLDLDDVLGNEARHASDSGKDGIVYTVKDLEIALTFDPSKIRSVNAAFDPDLKESAVLLAQAGATLDSIKQSAKAQGVKITVNEKGDKITLDKIIVPDDQRDTGVGTAVMNQLNQYADSTGKTISLTPSADFGGNKKRLIGFYKRFGFVENKGKNKDFEISESMYREPVTLKQEADTKTRATIQLLPEESIIKLHQASDLSSFLHESAHLFLDMEAKLSNEFGVKYFGDDQQAILNFLGVDSFPNIGREQHEKFAEAFEVYLREGKAPSLALRDAFAAFKRWLTRIYQSLTDPRLQRAELTPEITEVFDRMLATEAEIELATANPAYDQFFKSKEQSGMSDAEWEAYQARQLKAKNRATETLDTKLMKELTRRKTAEWNEEKQPLIDEETERLSQEPVYSILNDTKEFPMDYDAVKEIMGFTKMPGRLIGKLKKGGVDPQEYSEMHGYSNVEAMINEMVSVEPLKKAANDAAEARMVEKYGDILNDGSIEDEAREAIHNDAQAQLLLDEIKALKPERANKINRAYLKAEAKTLIGSMNFKEIKPNKYYRAEIKAAQQAVTATDKESQYIAKVQQLANHYMYREAVDTKERMVKQRKYIKSTQTREYNTKQVNPEYVHNMKTLANLYDMRVNTDRALALGQIVDWYNTQINDPNQYVAIELLDINLIKALQAKQDGALPNLVVPTFNDLTAQDLQGLHEMLRHLRYVGGVMSDLGKAEQAALVESIKDSIIKNGGNKVKGTRGIPQKGLEAKIKFSTLVNKIPSLRNLIRKLDGNFKEQKEEGLADKEIYRVIEAANSEKIRLGRELYEIFETELGDIHRIGLVRTDDKTYVLDSGLTLDVNTESRFMMAVYWGTESSRDAIRDGYGLTDGDVSRILADLTNDQIRTVNSVWKVNETQWPELSKASVNMYGVSPTKLDPTPFAINGIEMTGGHMRLIYSSTKTEKLEEARKTDLTSVVPTKAGSLHARVGGGGKPVKLYTTNISQALEENTHFIAFAEVGRKIQSIINHPDIVAAIETYHGEGFYKAFVGNIESTVANRQQRESDQALAGIAKLLRKAAVYKHLAFSIRNVVQQVSAIAPVVEEVGVVPFVGAAQRFISNERQDLINFVDDRSEFMRDRASLVNKEASDFLRSIEIKGSFHHAWDKLGRKGFMFQTMVDATLAYPTWLAKYEARFELHGDDKRAASEADSAVAESVGSGSDLHLGAWFSKNQTEWMRIFTLFGSWFNAYYQRIYKSTSGLQKFDMDSFKALFATPIITAVLSAVIIMDYPDDDSDEAFTEWLVKRYVYFMAGTLPFVREIAGSFSGFAPKTIVGGGQEVPSRFINELVSLAEGKQTTLKGTSDIIKLVTTVVPVPGVGNVTRIMDFIDSNTQGKETGSPLKKIYQAVTEGPDRNK